MRTVVGRPVAAGSETLAVQCMPVGPWPAVVAAGKQPVELADLV